MRNLKMKSVLLLNMSITMMKNKKAMKFFKNKSKI